MLRAVRASAYRLVSVSVAVGLVSLAGCSLSEPADPESTGETAPASAGTSGAAGAPGSGAGAGGASGALAVGGANTASAGAAGAGQASGGAKACGDYADQAPWQLKIRIENQRTTTVYVGAEPANCPGPSLFEVEDGSRALLPGLGDCRASCSAMMAGAATSCPSACSAPSTVTLAPGQVIELPWDGRFAVPQTLPRSCVSATTPDPASCVQASHIDAGPYTFRAKAGTKHDCVAGTACNCAPTADGNCTTPQSFIGGTVLTTEFFVLVDPGETGPNGQLPIELVFKD